MTMARTLSLSICLVIGLIVLTPDRPAAQSGSHLLDVVELLANGETVFGSFANIESGAAGAIDMSRSQGDYIFFDMEHGALDMNEMRHYMQYLLDPAKILRRGRPGTDIAISARLNADLLELFEDKILPVIASYNAGEDRVEEWWAGTRHLRGDFFVDSIPYSETRRFAREVIANLAAYERVYATQN